jgi:hypothetical protein
MRDGSSDRHYLQPRAKFVLFMFVAITIMFVSPACCQTASTGALNGVTLDPSGAILPGVALNLVTQDTDETQTAISDGGGGSGFFSWPQAAISYWPVKQISALCVFPT